MHTTFKALSILAAASVAAYSSLDIAPRTAGVIHFTVAAAGNKARYRVREQLMGKDFPNDAIGERR